MKVRYFPVFNSMTSCGRLALACSADAQVTGFLAKLGQVGGAEITHAGLGAADELSNDEID